MKIQGMAIIFIIIILPITIVVGEYAATQIEIFRLEQLYDSRLITATDDALKAFQINTFNDAYSSISNSKIDSIEASVNAFYNSMVSSFGMQGYSGEELLNYVPALVYTMYDGYYIYSPYTNVADISEGNGLEIDLDSTTIEYGLKPYVYYSCRYTMGTNSDFIINYSLDNYITIQGIVKGESVYKSGYLLTLDEDEGLYKKTINGFAKYYYNGQEISAESELEDLLLDKDAEGNIASNPYKYIKLNDIKYYWDEEDELIFYLAGENRVEQAKKSKDEDKYNQYVNQIQLNRSAINYYKSAYEFTNWVKDNLGNLKLKNAETDVPLSGDLEDYIFIVDDEDNKIEYAGSNFNLHRKEVIRYSIESNLSVAIANFNSYTNSNTNFQMPKLKETEWDLLESEISIISFLQGLNLGGKIYNGYTVVSNAKTEEVVTEDSIYITTNDGYYHRINAKYFDEDDDTADTVVAGVLNLDFETRKDGATGLPYRQKIEYGSYTSIVGQEKINTDYESIYEYLDEESVARNVKEIYYTALGRERWATYQIENSSNLLKRINKMTPSNDYEIVIDGLIRHYEATNIDGKGDINLGTTEWIDLSGHYDGIINGSTVTSEGYVSFDGIDDWVNIGKISEMEAITLEATFLLNSLPTGSNSYQIISNTQFSGFALYLNKNGRLSFEIRSEDGSASNSLTLNSSVNLETNKIYNVSVTYDGAVAKIYINGYVYGEVAYSGKIYEPKYDTVTSIGVNLSDSPTSFYGYADVNIYSARIYDRALTSDEVKTNYNIEKDKLPEPLEPPSISITNLNIYPNRYMSDTQKPTLSAVLKVDSEGLPLEDVKYVFTTSEIAPTEGWRSLSDEISEEGKLAERTLTYEATSTGIWRLYVKATNARGENYSYAMFEAIQIDNTPPAINIQLEHSNYEIAEGETSVNIYVAVWADDGTGSGVATLRAVYTTTSTTPSDEVFETEGQDMLRSNPIGRTNTIQGTYYLHAKVIDLAGNEAVKCVPFTVTKEEAEATCDITIENTDGKTEYTSAATVQIHTLIADNVKKTIKVNASRGVSKIEYALIVSTSDKDINDITDWTTVLGNGATETSILASGRLSTGGSSNNKVYLYVRVTDMDGNITPMTKSWDAGLPKTNVSV